MNHTSIVLDNFFDDFPRIRRWADEAEYRDVVNPGDGVLYPGICELVPEHVADEMVGKVESVMGFRIFPEAIFARLSTLGSRAPHQAHTDATMGQYSLMIYLNRPEHCAGGTSLLRNRETGEESNPVDEYGLTVWKRDCNIPMAWDKTLMCGMKPNRAFIFPAGLYHRAEPIGGFGKDARDGRLVLTMFFDKVNL